MKLLEVKGVHKHYEGPGSLRRVSVLKGVDFTIETGMTVAVLGPSGSGKSTLLNILGGLDRPSLGSVAVKGRDLSGLSDKNLAALRNQEIGFVFQRHLLLPQCTVWENVLIPTLPALRNDAENAARAADLIDRVGLTERTHYCPGELSGGERQRVAVVRALINRPSLLLADEPTGSLDQASSLNLVKLLLDMNRESGTALILVTHSLEAAGQMQERFFLRGGRLEADR